MIFPGKIFVVKKTCQVRPRDLNPQHVCMYIPRGRIIVGIEPSTTRTVYLCWTMTHRHLAVRDQCGKYTVVYIVLISKHRFIGFDKKSTQVVVAGDSNPAPLPHCISFDSRPICLSQLVINQSKIQFMRNPIYTLCQNSIYR